MAVSRLAVVAAHFGRDLDRCLDRVAGLVEEARRRGVHLLVLPAAALGGYLPDLAGRAPDRAEGSGAPGSGAPGGDDRPPALERDHPCFTALARLAGDLVVCVGYTEVAPSGGAPYNAAVCLSGDGVLGRHRKVHQPAGEAATYAAGDGFAAFDTPVGRVGLLIDYDKTFPEAARTLALDGAQLLACLSAWPASLTNRAARLVQDRQTRLFDLYDAARAAENQVALLSANQTGTLGGLRFLGQAKVVGPGGEVLARTYEKAGIACADLDLEAEVARVRLVLHHLEERRPATYRGLA